MTGTTAMTEQAIPKTASPRHWKAWNFTTLFLLYGSTTKKTIAGMMVTYARPLATLSASPPPAAAGAAAAPPPADCPAAFPHAGHAVALSAICPPQAAQNRGILIPPKFCCKNFYRRRPEAAH